MKIRPHIYLIFDNIKNRPYYVGKQSNQDPSYITGSTYLKRYMRLYGRKTFKARFSKIILEYVEKENLDAREEFFIGEFLTFKEGGNRTKGGHWDVKYRVQKKKPVSQFSMEGKFIRDWKSTVEPFNTGYLSNRDGVSACCRGKQKACGGYMWKYKSDKTTVQPYTRAVYPSGRKRQISVRLDGVHYSSLKEATRTLGIDFYTIKRLIS